MRERLAGPDPGERGIVRVHGPGPLATALRAAVRGLAIEHEDLGPLDVDIAEDGRHAEGVIGGRVVWSIPVPSTQALPFLLGQVVATITTLLARLVFVHAGVVALGGRAWLLVGESGAGKTSTVAALLQRQATYFSDEVALLDPATGSAIPFCLPMAIKPWTRQAVGTLPPGRDVAGDGSVLFRLPRRPATAPMPVGMFVFLAANGRPRVTPVPRSVALLELARHPSSFQFKHRVTDAFAGFARALRSARCVRLEAPLPASCVDLLLDATGSSAGSGSVKAPAAPPTHCRLDMRDLPP